MKVERVSREEVIGVEEAYTEDQEHVDEGLGGGVVRDGIIEMDTILQGVQAFNR